MLPAQLAGLKIYLENKGVIKRTIQEDKLLEDIIQVDKAIDKAKRRDSDLIEGVEKRAIASPSVYGPGTDVCPTCGKDW